MDTERIQELLEKLLAAQLKTIQVLQDIQSDTTSIRLDMD